MKNNISENELICGGYVFLGEVITKSGKHELWRLGNDIIVYSPEKQKIVWVQHNELKLKNTLKPSQPISLVNIHRIDAFRLLFGELPIEDSIKILQSIKEL